MTGMNVSTGAALDGLDHIRQSVADILTTPIGSRVMVREYGSDVPELIDMPQNGANLLRLYAATAYAIKLWEPRISLTSLQFERDVTGRSSMILDGVAGQQNVQLAVPL